MKVSFYTFCWWLTSFNYLKTSVISCCSNEKRRAWSHIRKMIIIFFIFISLIFHYFFVYINRFPSKIVLCRYHIYMVPGYGKSVQFWWFTMAIVSQLYPPCYKRIMNCKFEIACFYHYYQYFSIFERHNSLMSVGANPPSPLACTVFKTLAYKLFTIRLDGNQFLIQV